MCQIIAYETHSGMIIVHIPLRGTRFRILLQHFYTTHSINPYHERATKDQSPMKNRNIRYSIGRLGVLSYSFTYSQSID